MCNRSQGTVILALGRMEETNSIRRLRRFSQRRAEE